MTLRADLKIDLHTAATAQFLKSINIKLEVSSTFLRLLHVCSDIATSGPEFAISAGRASKTLKFAKSTFQQIFNGSRHQ